MYDKLKEHVMILTFKPFKALHLLCQDIYGAWTPYLL